MQYTMSAETIDTSASVANKCLKCKNEASCSCKKVPFYEVSQVQDSRIILKRQKLDASSTKPHQEVKEIEETVHHHTRSKSSPKQVIQSPQDQRNSSPHAGENENTEVYVISEAAESTKGQAQVKESALTQCAESKADENIESAVTEVPIFEFAQLKPAKDVVDLDSTPKCAYCFAEVASEEVGKLHAIAHKTNCCSDCDFGRGALCVEHASKYNVELPSLAHTMVLGRFGTRYKPTYLHLCMFCQLATHEEADQNVICNYKFCEKCTFSTESQTKMKLHMLKHCSYSSVEFGCPVCPEEHFSSLDSLEEHMDQPHSLDHLRLQIRQLSADEAPIWHCAKCSFKGRSEILAHMKCHPIIKCALCQNVITIELIPQHVRRERLLTCNVFSLLSGCSSKYDNELYQCRCCDLSFKYKSDMEQHALLEHKHCCKLCDQMLSNKETMTKHVRSHTDIPEDVMCRVCFFVTFNLEKMQQHKANHAILTKAERKFVCSICNINCTSEQELMRHRILVHKKNGSFRCFLCKQDFKDWGNLNLHYGKRHPWLMGEVEGCKCTHCEFTDPNVTKSNAFNHFWTCFYCGATISSEHLLRRHCKAMHSDNHYCSYCDQITKDKYEYQRHCKTNAHISNANSGGISIAVSPEMESTALPEDENSAE